MTELFIQLSVILGIALIFALLMKSLRQPLIVGHILTGFIVGPTILGVVAAGDAIDAFGNIGVIFLLFIIGLSLRPKLIKDVGKISILTGVGQIIFTTLLGFIIGWLVGYDLISALYLAIAFTFSSTIIILQLLYTKEEHETLYGRISIGFLLVQDFAAMILFLFLSSLMPGVSLMQAVTVIAIKLMIVAICGYVLMSWIVPRIAEKFSRNKETLFLFSLFVCFFFVVFFDAFGFSRELGALLAGIMLSVSPHHRDIAIRLAPLRDFFIMMFFIVLGTQVSLHTLTSQWLTISIFSIFILIGNPLIVMAIMKPLGYSLATSFYSGLTVAQISEFSLILLAAGASLGHIPFSIISTATVVGLITIFCSSYFIMHNKFLYIKFEPLLRSIFGPDKVRDKPEHVAGIDVILFGCHRLGGGIVDALEGIGAKFVVVDHDPAIATILRAGNIPHVLGVADDPGLLDSLPLSRVKSVISTIPDFEVNRNIVEYIRGRNKEAIILCVANHQEQAAALYESGATYVIVPPFLGRLYLVDLLTHYRLDKAKYERERQTHMEELVYLKESI